MKISARNVLKGQVVAISKGSFNAEVTVEVGPGTNVVSVITLEALERLEIVEGMEIYAAFDAAHVLLGTPHHKRGD
jgi:molybdate transport system regulatory protein